MSAWAAETGHSLAFISRLDIAHYEWHELPVTRRRYLEVVLAATNARVFGVHLRAVHANWSERRRVRELRALLESIAQYRKGFHILTGDFNTLAPGAILDARQLPFRLQTLLWLSGRQIRWETIQMMLDAEYLDGYRILHPLDSGFTFPVWNPHVRLDYVFLPLPFADRLKFCGVLNKGLATKHASDHFPLLSVLEIA
jgi:exodeoxyribonuclease-3